MKNNSMESLWNFKGEVDYVDDWLLMKTPFPLFFITVSYLLFVLKVGPQLMKNRPAPKVEICLVAYNAIQVAFSLYLIFKCGKLIWSNGLLAKSCMMDTMLNRSLVTSANYAYFLAKVSELIDTIFFVIRKKQTQVTFLHVYHHVSILWCSWFILKYEPSYSAAFLGTLNSFVHVIMYTYYGLSTFPHLAKFLWWKKYITSMQLVQFFLIIIQAALSSKFSGCPPTFTLKVLIYFNAFLFIYLFSKFYIKTYTKPKELGRINIIEKSSKFN